MTDPPATQHRLEPEPDAACVFCGQDPAPLLFLTPICRACAGASRVVQLHQATRSGIALVHVDGREHWLVWREGGEPARTDWDLEVLAQRQQRHRAIAAGQASLDDPALVAKIDTYEAQVGWSPLVERIRARQLRETAMAIAEVERWLGLVS
jgi:hypothetical protein